MVTITYWQLFLVVILSRFVWEATMWLIKKVALWQDPAKPRRNW